MNRWMDEWIMVMRSSLCVRRDHFASFSMKRSRLISEVGADFIMVRKKGESIYSQKQEILGQGGDIK